MDRVSGGRTTVNFWTCWCGYRMPEQNKRAIAGHQQQHPTAEQIEERRNAKVLEMAVDSMYSGRQLSAIERWNAIHAMLNAKPETIFEELWRKPLMRELDTEGQKGSEKS